LNLAIIHIADIHLRSNEVEGAVNIFNRFIDDIEKQIQKIPDHSVYLAITGDVVYEGSDSESYDFILNEFDVKLNKIGIEKNSRIMVPGNHDIDREITKIDVEQREKFITQCEAERDFNNYYEKKFNKNCKFDNYKIFDQLFSTYGIDDNSCGRGWKINDTIGVYCLNTALCSFGGVNKTIDYGQLAIQTRELQTWCDKHKCETNILLMHHPLAYLNEWSKKELKLLLDDNFHLCLCGHNHQQEIYYNKFQGNTLICSAPQLFTDKNDDLGYGIIFIENRNIKEIKYRQYVNGKFLCGQEFTGNETGTIVFDTQYKRNRSYFEKNLNNSLKFFKNQNNKFVRPKISKEREFNDNSNLLDEVIKKPENYHIISQPQFGLTCLSHYMILEAFKYGSIWGYVECNNCKSRNIESVLDNQSQILGINSRNFKCIIVDSWNCNDVDHNNMLKKLMSKFEKTPLILLSNYTDKIFNGGSGQKILNENFSQLHLQALQRNKVRQLVQNYKHFTDQDNEDSVVSKLITDIEALNIHRTPLNCLTLLKVFEDNFYRDVINRTKLIKTVLFILFTDSDSFTYSTTKPEVEDCEYIIGMFCKNLVKSKVRRFLYTDYVNDLKAICKEKFFKIDIELLVDILESNNILIRYDKYMMFKHSYWIYYFAALSMHHDDEFRQYILSNRNYTNFPEIIEFYTGIDSKREDAISQLLLDLDNLISTVDDKIGIKGDFNPFNGIIWNPSGQTIKEIQKDIKTKVLESNLPTKIKDQYADDKYDSEMPYDQTIKDFMQEYSVASLISAINASSRALRNSNFIDSELKIQLIESIFNAWEQISRVLFWISSTLAKYGKVNYDGWSLLLIGEEDNDDIDKRFRNVCLSNPINVVQYFKDSLSAKKIGPLVNEMLRNSESQIQQHLISLFLIKERPDEWNKELFEFTNSLHRNSFLLANIFTTLKTEIDQGFVCKDDRFKIVNLLKIVSAKHKGSSSSTIKKIPDNMTVNKDNKLPIDKILATNKGPK